MTEKHKKWALAVFAVYCLLMLWLLFGQRWGQFNGTLSLKPFDTIRRFWWVLRHSTDPLQLRHAVVNLAGNVAMFVPLGFLTPCIWDRLRKFGWHALTMVLTIVAIELLQLVTRLGSCDVDDLLLNLVGTTLGYLGWKCILALRNRMNGRKGDTE